MLFNESNHENSGAVIYATKMLVLGEITTQMFNINLKF